MGEGLIPRLGSQSRGGVRGYIFWCFFATFTLTTYKVTLLAHVFALTYPELIALITCVKDAMSLGQKGKIIVTSGIVCPLATQM